VNRVCYDDAKRFMVVQLKSTYYPYCEFDSGTLSEFLSAESMGRFFNERIRSKRDGTHGPFDCRDHPMPTY
jgi:hypothetical protein